jgi:DNA primase
MPDLVRRTIPLRKVGNLWEASCPFHNDPGPSFKVYPDHAYCFGCGRYVNAITWVMEMLSLDFPLAIEYILGIKIERRDEFTERIRDAAKEYAERNGRFDSRPDDRGRAAIARSIWLNRAPLADSIAARYLKQTRGIRGPYPADIGFAPSLYFSPTKKHLPALLAAIRDGLSEICAVQRIFLNPETARKAEPSKDAKRTKGPMRDGAVRLAKPGKIFGLAGSVEDALAVIRTFSIPCWATCGEARLKSAWIPDCVKELVIFGDNDERGRKFAMEAVIAHDETGKYDRVFFELPPKAKDWNENLIEATR